MPTTMERPMTSWPSPATADPRRAGAPDVLRDRIAAILAAHGIPGVSIAVVDRDGLRWADGIGLADLRAGTPAQADTVYHLFSGTKLFTATAVMQLVERGAVALDAPIGRYLAEAAHLPGVTVRHLLSHTSGLRESLRGLLAARFPDERPLTADEALANFPLVAARAAGTRVEYRNVNYALLGAMIGRVTGIEYRTYVTTHILEPLGMQAAFTLTPAMRALAATGYIDRWDPMRLALRLLHPAVARRVQGPRDGRAIALAEYDLATAAIGGLVGSVPEFARFLQAQLGDGGPVLSAESSRAMRTMVATGAAGIVSRTGVGLGWKFGEVEGRPFLNHEGGGAGFTSELRLYPREGLGIALAMNAMRMPRTMRVAHAISEAARLAPSDR